MATLIEVKDLVFSYDDRPVLKEVSFTVREGEFIGLIGPNGSGKTTLLRTLLGLLTASSGEILLDSKSLYSLSRRDIATQITLVPQDTMLNVPFKGREIVAMGRTPYLGRFRPEQASDKAAINYALNVTQTTEFADRFITELSGGERQRIVIARAIAQETPIILLDEPTSNLDVSHQLEILELIRNLVGKGRCAIASLHDLSLAARFCDRLFLLAGGELAADGRPREVMTSSNLATFFRIQAEIKDDEQTGSLMVWPISPLKKSSTRN